MSLEKATSSLLTEGKIDSEVSPKIQSHSEEKKKLSQAKLNQNSHPRSLNHKIN